MGMGGTGTGWFVRQCMQGIRVQQQHWNSIIHKWAWNLEVGCLSIWIMLCKHCYCAACIRHVPTHMQHVACALPYLLPSYSFTCGAIGQWVCWTMTSLASSICGLTLVWTYIGSLCIAYLFAYSIGAPCGFHSQCTNVQAILRPPTPSQGSIPTPPPLCMVLPSQVFCVCTMQKKFWNYLFLYNMLYICIVLACPSGPVHGRPWSH